MAKPYYKSIDDPVELDDEALELFHRQAVPGESLTGDPAQPQYWERPPEVTTIEEGLYLIINDLFEREQFVSAVAALGKGVSVVDLASQILYVGFQKGKWNPDLMLLLLEPLMYVLLYAAERAGVKDVVGYLGEEEDAEGTEEGRLDALQNIIQQSQVPLSARSVAIPPELKQKLEDTEITEQVQAEVQSILDKPPVQQEGEQKSLLERGVNDGR